MKRFGIIFVITIKITAIDVERTGFLILLLLVIFMYLPVLFFVVGESKLKRETDKTEKLTNTNQNNLWSAEHESDVLYIFLLLKVF